MAQKQESLADDSFASLNVAALRSLLAIIEERNVTRAAARLGVTQSTLSSTLLRLRQQFGDPLMVRLPHGMTPTVRAEEIGQRIRRVLVELDALRDPNADFDPARLARSFTITATDQVQAVTAPALLAALRDQAPGVQIVFRAPDPAQVANWLQNGEVNLGLGYLSAQFSPLRSRRVYRDRFVCAAAADNTEVGETLTRAQFASLPKVMGAYYRQIVTDALSDRSYDTTACVLTPNFLAAASLIADSGFIGILPERLVRKQALCRHLLRVVRLPFELPLYDVRLYWHERDQADIAHRWIRELVVKLAGSY